MRQVCERIEKEINLLKKEQAQYNYDELDSEVALRETQLQEVIEKRNSKKTIYDGYQTKINRLESTKQVIMKLEEESEGKENGTID